jgi:hypothetical protein
MSAPALTFDLIFMLVLLQLDVDVKQYSHTLGIEDGRPCFQSFVADGEKTSHKNFVDSQIIGHAPRSTARSPARAPRRDAKKPGDEPGFSVACRDYALYGPGGNELAGALGPGG